MDQAVEFVKKHAGWIAVGVVGVAATVIAVVAKQGAEDEIVLAEINPELDETDTED